MLIDRTYLFDVFQFSNSELLNRVGKSKCTISSSGKVESVPVSVDELLFMFFAGAYASYAAITLSLKDSSEDDITSVVENMKRLSDELRKMEKSSVVVMSGTEDSREVDSNIDDKIPVDVRRSIDEIVDLLKGSDDK